MTSHTSPFISLPRKSTGETDFAGPIRQTIGQVYGERPDGYAEDIATLTRCRGDAVKGAGSDVTARDLLFKYFGQLELLELRFAETKISFTWDDAYTHKPTTQTSLAFEKASILHLLSSVLSHLGATSPRTSPEGVKRAYASLRQAAGLLNFINENFLHAPSTDLSREVVSLSGKLMIAQAGETFLEKCISEKKPVAIVCKMCQSVAQSYGVLQEDAKEFQGKGILDRNWVNVFAIKAKHFASLAQWYRAGIDTGKGDHGPGLVRYGLAQTLANEAHKLAKEFNYSYTPSSSSSALTGNVSWGEEAPVAHSTLPFDAATALLEITKAHLTVATEAKTTADKDNDLVYHALAPSESSLPPIEALPSAGLAAPISIQEIYAQPAVSSLIGPDIFRRLVPLEVHEKASVYSEEKAKLVRAEQERCDVGESETRAGLDDLRVRERIHRYMGIIDGQHGDQGGQGTLPREVANWAEEITSRERRDGPIEDVFRRNDQRRDRAQDELQAMAREMDEESRECEKMRAKHGHLWTQGPSSSHNRQYKEQVKSHLDSLNSAHSSDRTIVDTWNSIQWSVDVLRGPRHSLEKMYSDAAAGKDPSARLNLLDVDVAQEELDDREREDLQNVIAELQERVDRMDKVRRERDEVLKDLKEKIQTDDVSHLLLLNRRSQGVEPTLFASELEKFSPYQDRISAALASQSVLLDEMAALIKQAESGRGVRDAQRKMGGAAQRRDDLDRRFRAAYEGYVDARTDLDKGSHFYDNLTTLTDGLRRNVRGFISSRTQERNQAVDSIENRGSRALSPSRGGDGLESALGNMSILSRSPVPPAPSPYASSGYNPRASPSASRQQAPPPPPPPASNPYDFASFGNLPSAFSTDARQSSMSPPLPPPPPKMTSSSSPYSSYSSPPPAQQYPQHGSYSQPASGGSSSPYSSYTSSASAYPPPPKAPYSPAGQYGAPAPSSYSTPTSHYSSYPAPPAPGPPSHQSTYSSYPAGAGPPRPGSQAPYGQQPYGTGAPPPPPPPAPGGYGGSSHRPYY